MEIHTDAYYLKQRLINAGMGIPYDIEHQRLQDMITYNMYVERYKHLKKCEEIKENSKYIFLTVNPNAYITLVDFINKINKMMSKKWITNYLYVLEQRGETLAELGKGFHFHAIIEKPKTKSYTHMVRELSNSANAVCDTSNFHFFNIKSISEEECQRKIIYLTGRKADEAKHLKQEMDIVWRHNNNLLSFYNVGII